MEKTDELQSRYVRKGLQHRRHQIRPDLNQWIGAIFALGAALFAAASGLSLMPQIAQHLALSDANINALFFAGSIPFTTAAYLQLVQAANAPTWEHPATGKKSFNWFGWRPRDIGWLSCILQFAGTLLFNINTFDGMRTDMSWVAIDLLVWVPDLIGSLFFPQLRLPGFRRSLSSPSGVVTGVSQLVDYTVESRRLRGVYDRRYL